MDWSDLWRRATPLWAGALVVAGSALLFIAWDSEDPCCHATVPGLAVAGSGLAPLVGMQARLRRFETLLAESSSQHAFWKAEDELDRISRRLPSKHRARFLETHQRLGGTRSTSRRRRQKQKQGRQ